MAVQTAGAALLRDHQSATATTKEADCATTRRDWPLLDLQQRFVDLRFGMFLHFNMAYITSPTEQVCRAGWSKSRRGHSAL